MLKRSRKPKLPDPNVTAFRFVQALTGEPEVVLVAVQPVEAKNPAAVALGKLGGAKGGAARAAKLPPEKRKAIAKKAAEARWGTKANLGRAKSKI